ncbi:MAG TPA: N-acyl homoserine lactonase family protein, partial [bacterium]|nr:N-acyl homoserine lactonase family protein [bacterium]
MRPYKIFILKYARRDAHSSEIVLGDYHRSPMDMSYYIWVATNGEHTAVVDMGFTPAMCAKRGRQWLADPAVLMDAVGVDPGKVQHAIITHMHWDHVGYYSLFPKATFYVQEEEMRFWTGRHAKYPAFNAGVEVEDVCALVRLNYEGRVAFTQGSQTVLPGITVHKVAGHTAGIQIVEVQTASGPAVVASDAAHTYRNLRENRPFPLLHDVAGYLDGFELMR